MGFGTGGSRSATMAGGVALHGARALRTKVLELAAHLFEASPEDMELSAGGVSVRGVPARALPLGEIAQAAHQPGRVPPEFEGDLEVLAAYDGGEGGWAGGTHAAIVEGDVDTGQVRIERYL